MNNINILNDTKDFRQQEKSELYINIFGEEPRNEGYKCVNCNKTFGLSTMRDGNICTCNGKLERFYNQDEVMRDRGERATKEGYIGKLAENLDNKLIGFSLGRQTNIQDLNEEKLRLSKKQLSLLQQNAKNECNQINFNDMFYSAEIGIDRNLRGQGAASALYGAIEKELAKALIQYNIVRTTKKTDVPYKRLLNKGFKEVFSYDDEQKKVILINNLLKK